MRKKNSWRIERTMAGKKRLIWLRDLFPCSWVVSMSAWDISIRQQGVEGRKPDVLTHDIWQTLAWEHLARIKFVFDFYPSNTCSRRLRLELGFIYLKDTWTKWLKKVKIKFHNQWYLVGYLDLNVLLFI